MNELLLNPWIMLLVQLFPAAVGGALFFLVPWKDLLCAIVCVTYFVIAFTLSPLYGYYALAVLPAVAWGMLALYLPLD